MEITMYDKFLQLPLFQGLGTEEFTNILEKIKLHFHKFAPGELIAEQGNQCGQLIFILSGKIMSETADGKNKYTLSELIDSPNLIEPYSLFGMCTRYTATYRAIDEVQTLSIDKSYILTQLTQYPIFNLNFLNMLSSRVQTANNKLWNTHIGDTQEKIVNFVLQRCKIPSGKKTLSIRMDDLAELTNEARINISKVLNQLQEDKLVKLSRKRIEFEAIEQIKEQSYSQTRKIEPNVTE